MFNACVEQGLTPSTREWPLPRTDCGARSRFLSAVFDFVDAKAVVFLNRLLPFGMRSLSHMLFLLLGVWTAFLIFRDVFKGRLEPGICWMFACSIALVPQIMLHGVQYYRPAKIIAFCYQLCVLGLFICPSLRVRKIGLTTKSAIILLLSLGILADELCVAITAAGAVWALTRYGRSVMKGDRGDLRQYHFFMGVCTICALGFYVAFARWIEPILNLTFENVTLNSPRPSSFAGVDPFEMNYPLLVSTTMFYQLRTILGMHPYLELTSLVLTPLLFIYLVIPKKNTLNKKMVRVVLLGTAFLIVSYWGTLLLMAIRHSPMVTYPDIVGSGSYYYLTFASLLIFGFAMMGLLVSANGGWYKWSGVVIVLCWSVASFQNARSMHHLFYVGGKVTPQFPTQLAFREVLNSEDPLVAIKNHSAFADWEKDFLTWYLTNVGRTL